MLTVPREASNGAPQPVPIGLSHADGATAQIQSNDSTRLTSSESHLERFEAPPVDRPELDRAFVLYQNRCFLVVAAHVTIIAILAGRAAQGEHVIFHVCDAAALLGLCGSAILRCSGYLSPNAALPVVAWCVWLLALLLSLGPPSRRRQILGLEDSWDSNEAEACEEGSTTFWIVLLLSALPALTEVSAWAYALLGLLVSLQHLAIGLILPRPECDSHRVPWGPPGRGVLLGMPPISIATLQLLVLTAFFVWGNVQRERQRQVEVTIAKFLATRKQRSDHSAEFIVAPVNDDLLAQTRVERIINEFEKEEQDVLDLLEDIQELLPYSSKQDRMWVALIRCMSGIMAHSCSQLKRRSVNGDRAHEQLFSAIDQRSDGDREAAAVFGWLEHTVQPLWTTASKVARRTSSLGRKGSKERSPSPSQVPQRRNLRVRTINGLYAELGLGEWDFDALTVEKEKKHVLQLVGFELLRGFPTLPRAPLAGFLDRLENAYIQENAYHTHVHGADVCNAFWWLASKTQAWEASVMTDHARAASLIAALGHDVGHFAFNNLFLVASRNDLAVTYNDRSVLECFHASTLQRLLEEPYGEGPYCTQVFVNLSPESRRKTRQLMISLILGTDTQQHLDDLSALRVRLGSAFFDPLTDQNDHEQTLRLLFRAADINHSAKEWRMHEMWTRRIVQEFFLQGDHEKGLGMKVSPLCDRDTVSVPSSQVGFLQFICLPTWRELSNMEDRLKGTGRKRSRAGSTVSKSSVRSAHSGNGGGGSRPGSSRPGSSPGGRAAARSAAGLDRLLGPRLLTPPTMGSFGRRRRSMPAVQMASNAETTPDDRSETGSLPPTAAPPQLSLQAVEAAAGVVDFDEAASQSGVSDRGVSGISERGVSGISDISVPGSPPPRRWLAEVCLPLCEANYQIWKMQAAASDVCQRSGPALPCVSTSPGGLAMPGQVNNSETEG